eukprot:4300819-Alexandrium_andersonii.AAC.1
MSASLVGSEMCIRDRLPSSSPGGLPPPPDLPGWHLRRAGGGLGGWWTSPVRSLVPEAPLGNAR